MIEAQKIQEIVKKSRQVLIVDDIPENLQLLSTILNQNGIEISFATSGKQALELLSYSLPDLILLDVSMPEMDGFEVCKRIKLNENTSHIPVIFLTAKNQSADIIQGFEVGAADYVSKPFNSMELLARVCNHIEFKQSKELIIQKNLQLNELNVTKDKFFSIIAHDLKNPFGAILGLTEILKMDLNEMSKEEIGESISQLNSASKQIYSLLENLLNWAMTQTGKIISNPEKIDLHFLLNDLVKLNSTMVSEKKLVVFNQIKQNTFVFADTEMVKTIFRNLLNNAIKYSHAKGIISFSAKWQRDGFVDIVVADNGIGISEIDQQNLFKIGFSHIKTGTNNEIGTGLGLILCKEFVEKNNGKIIVESELGKGSKFIVSLKEK